jgi:Fe-S oxidoreductase
LNKEAILTNIDLIDYTSAYACLDCGKCTVVCPISRYDSTYSPRRIVYDTVYGRGDGMLNNGQLWDCISCSMCEERCQSGVRYTELIRSLRLEAFKAGCSGECTHGGALQSMMHIMTDGNLAQDRLGWVDKSLQTAERSEVLYWVGCQPYFDVIFKDLGVNTVNTARGAVKLLNALGVTPTLLPNERCCGHDLLWAGDMDGFRKLAEKNIGEIKKSGASKIVTSCPEGYLTLKYEYPRYFNDTGIEVVHITELLAAAIAEGKLKFKPFEKSMTYHDPCRLGRFGGIYDAPRTVLDAIPGLELVEMPRNRANSLCCGTQAWINCGSVNRQIQDERLREAAGTGAEMLLTSCPKCLIHFQCAMNDGRMNDLDLEIEDLISLAGRLVQD